MYKKKLPGWGGNRLSLTARTLVVALAAGVVSTAASAQEAPVRISIGAQSLSSALVQLGEQASLQIVYLPEVVQGRTAVAISGSMLPDEALNRLLAGSGITYSRNGRNVSLSKSVAATTKLDAITVQGVINSATEGSGSYTATGPSSMSAGLDLSLRETPQSVSVITDQRMKDQNLTQLSDVVTQTAGLVFSGNVGSDSSPIYSRGFSVDTYLIDGVRLVSPYDSIFQSQDMALYDRVEVVRGATGLMNGIGSPAGAINMVRKKPFADFQTEVTLEGGSWGYKRGLFDLSTPLNESGSVRARMVAMAQDSDSYIDRLRDKRKVFYGVIEADLGDSTLLSAGVSHQRMDLSGNARSGMPAFASDGQRIEWSRSDSAASSWAYTRRYSTSYFVNLEHELANEWKLKASLSHIVTDADEMVGYLGGTPDRVTGAGTNIWATHWEYKPKQSVVDLAANGSFTLFGREHDAAFGVNFSRVDYTSPSYSNWYHDGWNGQVPNIYTWDGSVPVEPANPSVGTHGADERNNGAFASVRLRPADSLSVILGSRYVDWQRSTSNYSYATGISDDLRRAEHELVPYVGLTYDLDDNWTAYASYTKIFTPQNYKTVSGAYIDPLSGDSYEAGVKGEFLNGNLNVSGAVYEVKENNKAIAIPDTFAPDGSQAYEAKSGAKTRGFEVEVAGMVSPGWELAASYAYNRTVDEEGARINTGVPKSIAKLFTTYSLDGKVNGLTVGGGLRWQSKIYNDELGPNRDQRFTQPSYFVVDLLARYEINKNFTASLNVNNVFDKHYYTVAGNSYYGAPRSVNLSLTGRF